MVSRRAMTAAAHIALLAGCAEVVGGKAEEVRRTTPKGVGFEPSLAAEYREIALFEADEMSDWVDADRFARKALISAEGDAVPTQDDIYGRANRRVEIVLR